MKKKILGIAIVAMSVIALPVMAQAQQKRANVGSENTQCVNTFCKKSDCRAFEGLNLTDAQKEQLKQLGEKRRAAMKECIRQKQRNDSVARAGHLAAKKAYLDDVKAVLTPEQYIAFLENHFVSAGGQRGGKAIRMKHHGKKSGKWKDRGRQPAQTQGETL